MPSEFIMSSPVVDMKSPSNLSVDVNLNHLMVRRPRTPTSPNPLDNEELKRRSTGLSAFNDYVDLVKRHLMYAVREEVEILKQQIGEMMERIGQLEYENTVLRAEAKPETLNKLLLPRVTQAPPAVGLPTPATAGTQAPQIPLQASTQPAVAPQAHVQPAVQQPVHPAPASQVSHPPTSHPAPQAAQHPPAT